MTSRFQLEDIKHTEKKTIILTTITFGSQIYATYSNFSNNSTLLLEKIIFWPYSVPTFSTKVVAV